MGNGEREQCRGGALTNSSLFQLPLLCERLLPVSLVQVSPRVHPERQRLLFPRGTRQRLRGRTQAAGCLTSFHPLLHSCRGDTQTRVNAQNSRAGRFPRMRASAVEHSCRTFPTFSLPTSKAKVPSVDLSPLQLHAADHQDTNAVPLRLIFVEGFSLLSPC